VYSISDAMITMRMRLTHNMQEDDSIHSEWKNGGFSIEQAARGVDTVRRIAVVAPSMNILGGQGVQADLLVKNLRSGGCRVDFIPVDPVFPRYIAWLRRFRYLRTVVNQTLYIPLLLMLRHASVVHIFSASYWSFLLAPMPAMLIAQLMGKKTVLHYHSGEADDHLSRWGVLVHWPLRFADEIVVPSNYLRKVFHKHGYSATVVNNIVQCEHFSYRRRDAVRPILLSMRNLERHYRIDLVIKAFALVTQHYPGAILTICGYGSEERSLLALASSLGLSGIRFVGRVEQEQVPDLYDASDIMINASEVDNQPVSILEAFAAGIPVVSSDVGDVRDMLRNGRAGMLVPPNNHVLLAMAVMELLEKPKLAVSLANQARESLDQYSWEGVSEKWFRIYTRQPA